MPGLEGHWRGMIAVSSAFRDAGCEVVYGGNIVPPGIAAWDFLTRLYPDARYVVLTRHPLAVWSSYVDSFFDGDDRVAHGHNPLLERYVPAIARFLREAPVAIHRVRYEALMRDPETHARELARFLGIEFEPAMVDYGSVAGVWGVGYKVASERTPAPAV